MDELLSEQNQSGVMLTLGADRLNVINYYAQFIADKLEKAIVNHKNVNISDVAISLVEDESSGAGYSDDGVENTEFEEPVSFDELISADKLDSSHEAIIDNIDTEVLKILSDDKYDYIESIVVKDKEVAEVLKRDSQYEFVKIIVRENLQGGYWIRYMTNDGSIKEVGG